MTGSPGARTTSAAAGGRAGWVHRDPPLPVAAVTAAGPAARALADAAARRLDGPGAGTPLRAAASSERLLLLGEDLPWADGACYLGWEADVLVPTGARPAEPVDLLAGRARAATRAALVVVLPDAVLGLPAPRRAVDAPTLRAWAGR